MASSPRRTISASSPRAANIARAGPGRSASQQRLAVEPADPEHHDRAEGGVVTKRGEQLAAEPRAEAHALGEQHARHTRPRRGRARRLQHARGRLTQQLRLVPAEAHAGNVALVDDVGRGDLHDRLLAADCGAGRGVDRVRRGRQPVARDADSRAATRA